MELTPQLLETQQFPEKWRGYDQDAVDEFLERVGVGLGELQDRLRTTVARLKELESGSGSSDAPANATQSEPPAATRRSAPVADVSDSGNSEVSAVARALVMAQEASDAAIAEARIEGDRITAEAKAEATRITTEANTEAIRLTSEAEVRHEAATARLADADAHIAGLADEALADARAEAARLVAEANAEASAVTAEAKAEAARLTDGATAAAERDAEEVKKRRADELAGLEDEVTTQRREASALRGEISTRRDELRAVVDGLQALVGRVGSLTAGQEPAIAPEPEPPSEPAAEAEPEPEAKADAVVIDLTADEAKVGHAGSQEVDSGPATAESETESAPRSRRVQRSPKWATVDGDDTPTDRRALKVVGRDDASETQAGSDPSPLVEAVPAAAKASASENGTATDDPFLAALRGPDRVEFDEDGELDEDQSSFKRRRRRRL